MAKSVKLQDISEAKLLFGPRDENIKIIEDEFRVRVTLGENYLKVAGASVRIKNALQIIHSILGQIRSDAKGIGKLDIYSMIKDFKAGRKKDWKEKPGALLKSDAEKIIGPKTKGQREYVEAIKKYDIVFGVGPAGTGKTYLAMASAVEALKKQEVRRIILTRPAIEAGESLGFLPGDIYEKISPYLRPLYDALYDMMEGERIEKYLETGIIEVAPLAYMRGRTLNDAFIVLDEAQNATAEQMKMFLTRIGFDSKVVITGDITQSDLPDGKPLGLLQAQELLSDIGGIKFVYFSGYDVVRHELVQKIIEAYDKVSK